MFRNATSGSALTPVKQPQSGGDNPASLADSEIQSKFDEFLKALSNTLNDFTALEVNTMVVSKITGAKFHPMDAYEAIYLRCRSIEDVVHKRPGARTEVPRELWPQYHKLFKQLRSAYQRCPGVNQGDPLPNPEEKAGFDALMELTHVPDFVRTLRKLAELRAALDGGDITSSETDLIYAQTIMQLDGDVINRYHEYLFDPDNLERREFILKIHNDGVKAGERQWRGLIEFMVSFLQNILKSR